MIIAVLQFQVEVPWAESLKDKRSVVSGLKTRITQRHGAATAEVATHDSHRLGSLAAVNMRFAMEDMTEVRMLVLRGDS